MVIATRLDSFIAPPHTQQATVDALKQAFNNAGYNTPFDDFVSGSNQILVYAIILDSTKIYGTTYLRIRIGNTSSISQQLYSTWSVANHSGTNPSSEMFYFSIQPGGQINLTALDGGIEYKLVLFQQGENLTVLGYISPINKPNWWNLNTWNYCFVPTSNTFVTFRACNLNPYANTEYDASLNSARMGLANIHTNRRDILPGIIIYTQTNRGVAGRTSDDLVSVAASGTNRFDVLQVPGDTKEYLILNPASGGLAVRVI